MKPIPPILVPHTRESMGTFQSTAVLDIAYAADFSIERDSICRVVEEVRVAAEAGFSVGLLHLPAQGGTSDGVINPSVDRLVSSGAATVLTPPDLVRTSLCILPAPDLLPATILSEPIRLMPSRTLVITDRPGRDDDFAAIRAWINSSLGKAQWTSTRPDLLAAMGSLNLSLLGSLWHSWGFASRVDEIESPVRRPRVCCCAGPGQEHWPSAPERMRFLFDPVRFRVRLMGEIAPRYLLPEWQVLKPFQRDPSRFASRLDAFCYYPDHTPAEIPSTAIGTALSLGIPVFMPPHLRASVGRGPDYAELAHVPAQIEDRFATGRRDSSAQFDAASTHVRRLRRLVGRPTGRSIPFQRNHRRVAFVPTGGVGIGHVVRLLAVARRLSAEVEPIFLSLSPCLSVIAEAGFYSEYLAPHKPENGDAKSGAVWMSEQIADFLDRQRPNLLVFDGNNPPQPLLSALAGREDLCLVWMRRGMWRPSHDPSVLRKSRFFDLIIEPRDLAGSMDRGATSSVRDDVVEVDAIQFLDSEDLLERSEARAELNLDPEKTIALIQIGSPMNRDTVTLTDQLMQAAASYPDLQIAQLEWAISESFRELWPDLVTLRGFPVARYYRAFDFCISAAGYNSFHELLSAGIPTVFVPNEDSQMDDQGARARFAAVHGAGRVLLQEDFDVNLHSIFHDFMDTKHRELLTANALRLNVRNGAADAARLLEEHCL